LPNAEPDRSKAEQGGRLELPPVSTGSKNGNVNVSFPGSEIRVGGCDDGAAYEVQVGSGFWGSIAPDGWGRATIPFTPISTIHFGPWWGTPTDFLPGPPTLTPLPIDGLDRLNGTGGTCEQESPSAVTVKLRRNGVEIHQATFAPSWTTENFYLSSAPANASLDAGASAVLSLIGPGGGVVYDVGVPGQITGGTVTKAEEVES
jgi:hypothetical protein